MRFLLASTGRGAIAAIMGSAANADTVVSTATTTPLNTAAAGEIHITSAGSIKPTSGVAITINSNNQVVNGGAIAIKGSNNSTGILANPDVTANIINAGTITLDEDFTP